jgi:hypothetical protein
MINIFERHCVALEEDEESTRGFIDVGRDGEGRCIGRNLHKRVYLVLLSMSEDTRKHLRLGPIL